MDVKYLIRSLLTKPTIIPPACPKCGSNLTGHIKAVSGENNIKKLRKLYLKAGEYIKPKAYSSGIYGSPNAFCINCGNEWLSDEIEYRHLSKKEMVELKKERMITAKDNKELMNAYMLDIPYKDLMDYLSNEKDDESIIDKDVIEEDDITENDITEDFPEYAPVETSRKRIGKKIGKKLFSDYVLSPTVGVFADLFPTPEKKRKEREKF